MAKKALFKIIISISSIITRRINKYIDIKNVQTPEYWRQFIFYSIFMLMGVLSLFIIIPNIMLNLNHYKYGYVLVPIFMALLYFSVIFTPRLSFAIRSVAGPFMFYIFGISLIIIYGPDLDSFSWLFTFVMMISIFHTLKSAVWSSVLNFVSLIIIGILQSEGIIGWENIKTYPLLMFFTSSINFFTLNIILAIALNILIHRIYKSFIQMNQARDAIIQGLAKLAEYRDFDTGAHLERIKHYTRLLVVNLRKQGYYKDYITDEYIEDITISSILHDIGKVGVPDAILLKQGTLTEDEFMVIKKHPIFGRNVLQEIGKKVDHARYQTTNGDQRNGDDLYDERTHGDEQKSDDHSYETTIGPQEYVDYFSYISIARAIAYSHHEKWDGSGYPLGLKGEEIPLSARIVALADVYDALRSKRVYKKAFSHEQAIEIIRGERGKHFDPAIVDVFILKEQEFNTIHHTYG